MDPSEIRFAFVFPFPFTIIFSFPFPSKSFQLSQTIGIVSFKIAIIILFFIGSDSCFQIKAFRFPFNYYVFDSRCFMGQDFRSIEANFALHFRTGSSD